MKKAEIFRRYVLFIMGLFFAGIGVAFTKHGELGVSPISSVANVMSCKFTFFSIGSWLILWNCVMIVGQILILRRDFKLYQFLQIPLSFLFGFFTDFGMWLASFIPVPNYFVKLIVLFVGIVILSLGVSLSVIANVIMNSGEAIVKAIADKTGIEFGNVKVAFDISCVTLAILLSLLFFDFRIVGIREGTILSALCTGFVVKFFSRHLRESLEKVLEGR
ncbi:MAG: YitT family protein [Lachnospiraceae bacterium]